MNGLTVGQWAAIDAIASAKLPDTHPLMQAIATELNAAREAESDLSTGSDKRTETNPDVGQ